MSKITTINTFLNNTNVFVSDYIERLHFSTVMIQSNIDDNTQYELYIQQSNTKNETLNRDEGIDFFEPIRLTSQFFRVILDNSLGFTNTSLSLKINLSIENLNLKISNLPTDGATENTMNSIKTKTDKLTFDNINNLNVKVSNLPTDGATETTLNGIKTQLEKQKFDGDNLNVKISNLNTTELSLSDIKTAVEALDTHFFDSQFKHDLRVLRSEGRVFSATQFLNVLNNTHQYVLFNPVNSNKTLFCIETALSIKRSGNNYTLICNLQRIKGFSGGQGQTPVSMNFNSVGEGTISVAQVFRNVSSVSNETEFYKFQIDDTGTSNFVKEWKEYIEIAPGYGISMLISHVEQGESICPVFRWFEIPI